MNLSQEELNALLQSCKETMLEYEQTIEAANMVIEQREKNIAMLNILVEKQSVLIEQLKHQIAINDLVYK